MIVASLLVAAALMADNAHKEFLTDPPPAENTGTEENKADVIKRIVALRKQLRGQGQTLKPFNSTTLSLEQLKKYEKKIGTVQSSQGKGTEENKSQRDAVIKRIKALREQLRGQGQTLQPFNSTTLSLEKLKKYEKNLTVQSSQGKGTEENKSQRDAVIKRIKALREQLRGQGQAVQSLNTTTLSLDALKNLEADLKKQAGKSTTGAPPDPKYVDAAKCSQKTSKEQQKMYDYDVFILHKASNTWKCPSGWIPTGCWTGMTNGNKQCYRKKTNVLVTEPDTRSEDVKTLVADIQRIAKEIKGLGGRVTGSTRYRTAHSIQDVAKLQNRRDELNTQLADLKATSNNTPGAAPPPVEYVAPATPAPESTPAPVSFFYTPVSSTDPSALAPVSSASIESKITNIVKSDLASSCRDVASHYRNDIEKTESLVETVLDTVGNDVFVIVTWTGQGGDATGYATKIHIECLTNPTTKSTRGYDIYIWAPGATGQFVHRNGPGFGNWRMTGGKFQESWRSGTDGSIVTIAN